MKKLSLYLLILLLSTSCIDNAEPEGLGVAARKFNKTKGFALKDCRKKNCVSSEEQNTNKNRLVDPIKVIATKEVAYEKIMKIILKDKDINIVNSTDNYIRAKQTLYGKFITDIEFYFKENKEVQVRAAMRGMIYDFGNSRKVLESIRFKFYQNDY